MSDKIRQQKEDENEIPSIRFDKLTLERLQNKNFLMPEDYLWLDPVK